MPSVWTQAVALLTAVEDALAAVDRPVLRAFVAPGAAAPWDNCCQAGAGEGQAWVAVERRYPTDPFPVEDVAASPCAPTEFAAALAVGVLRCAHTVDDQGRAPLASDVHADAAKVQADADTVLEAIVCGFAAELDDPAGWLLGGWEPLGPSGGCVGGLWRLTVTAPACRCPDPLEE